MGRFMLDSLAYEAFNILILLKKQKLLFCISHVLLGHFTPTLGP